MSDIVERLRAYRNLENIDGRCPVAEEAAAEIEQLRAVLRLAIVFLNSLHLPVGISSAHQQAYDECRQKIRRALEEK